MAVLYVLEIQSPSGLVQYWDQTVQADTGTRNSKVEVLLNVATLSTCARLIRIRKAVEDSIREAWLRLLFKYIQRNCDSLSFHNSFVSVAIKIDRLICSLRSPLFLSLLFVRNRDLVLYHSTRGYRVPRKSRVGHPHFTCPKICKSLSLYLIIATIILISLTRRKTIFDALKF